MPERTQISATSELARLVDEVVKSGKGPGEEMLQKIIRELARIFSVRADEVAILQLSRDHTALHFVYPLKLRNVGSIPMTTSHSLAVRTARDKRPEMVNNFAAHKHPTIFEAVNLEEEKQEMLPIQKIISAPLLLDSKPVGVIQVSRKGKSLPTAGADFTMRDLTALITSASLVAKCFQNSDE